MMKFKIQYSIMELQSVLPKQVDFQCSKHAEVDGEFVTRDEVLKVIAPHVRITAKMRVEMVVSRNAKPNTIKYISIWDMNQLLVTFKRIGGDNE